MSASRPSCLLVLSSAEQGVSAQSFIHAFTLTNTTFTVQLAAPNGKATEYVDQDENSRRWLNDFRTKTFALPLELEKIEVSRYSCLLIPHAPGAVHDLARDRELAKIINHFIREKKPICAIGAGIAALCCARMDDNKTWSFKDYSMTSNSVFELARSPDFGSLPIVMEDFIKENGAVYSSSEPDAVHIVVDRHLITGQNESSSLIAVQNLILLCNQKQGKQSSAPR
ncbi:glutamine amidotransferase-like class 1 domain-containing protein 1 [Lingula anatina]|uniref:Glutamine amidotransferase-like class 1 domain-containing protein 1 n=1 Tax=Lingula anatina TaxID=7574 RepID=A0A1S3JE75_LINAN|nr:glutamine amidotransferase-like class 1 domain-containing protein 1 [Lingula anatina]|eukprot:XP_013408189.1 glutamine amidotransferase-like class 1 domain-containing protein 1 [Lingula anatina]